MLDGQQWDRELKRCRDQTLKTHLEPRVDLAFGSFSVPWSLLSSLRGRLLLCPVPSLFPTTEEDRLRLKEVSEGVPTDSDPDGDDNPWMKGPAGG